MVKIALEYRPVITKFYKIILDDGYVFLDGEKLRKILEELLYSRGRYAMVIDKAIGKKLEEMSIVSSVKYCYVLKEREKCDFFYKKVNKGICDITLHKEDIVTIK